MEKFFNKYTVIFLLVLSFAAGGYKSREETIIFNDELIVEDAAYSMAKGGSLIIPTVNGGAYLAKPPLLYWLYAPLYQYFPPTAFLRRVWMIIFGILLTYFVFLLAKKWYGRQIAVYSTLFFVCSFPFVYFTKAANWDLVNAFFITLTIYFYNHKRLFVRYILTFASLGIAVLNRSYLALIPLVVITVNETIGKRRYVKWKLLIFSILLFLLIILPWHIVAFRINPEEFIRQYIQLPFQYHFLARVAGDTVSTPFFYFNIFFLFPPIIFILAYWGHRFIAKKINLKSLFSPTHIQLTAWITGYAAILIFSATRHEWYLLPLFPAVAIACGYCLVKIFRLTQGSRAYNLYSMMAFVFLLSPLYALVRFPLPEAEIIQAVKFIEESSDKNSAFYVYKYDMVPLTTLYPPYMKGIIVNNSDFLEDTNGKKLIIVRTADLAELPSGNNKQIGFKGDLYSVVTYN